MPYEQLFAFFNLVMLDGTGAFTLRGGMPMVVLCGQNVAKKIVAWDNGGTLVR